MNFLHLSDTHLLCNTADDVRGFNTFNSLNNIIEKIILDKPTFEFIIVSGDISQSCTAESYQLFKLTLQRLNKPVYCIPGNHDNDTLLQQNFPNTPTNSTTTVTHENTLLLFINTQVKDQQYGTINNEDLNKIISTLKTSPTQHVVIILHHPPIKINSIWMDKIGLKNGTEFLNAVKSYKNLKLILFGHVHQDIDTEFRHIKILATPSTCYQFKPNAKNMTYDDINAGYRIVKIDTNGTIESDLFRLLH